MLGQMYFHSFILERHDSDVKVPNLYSSHARCSRCRSKAAVSVRLSSDSRLGDLYLAGISVLIFLSGVWLAAATRLPQFVLYEDRLEIPGLFKRDILFRDSIRGWRIVHANHPMLFFEMRNPGAKPVRISCIFRADPLFTDWMNTLTCLDL